METETIRLILADDHKLFREGLKSLLAANPAVRIAGEAANGRDAVQLCSEIPADVVIMDIAMPELNGVEASRQILAKRQDIKIIALSMHSGRRFIVEMLKIGVSGYLLKDCAFQELDMALTTVLKNKIYISPDIAGIVTESLSHGAGNESRGSEVLTSRETEILQVLAEGKKTKEIARELNISVKTVQTHRRNIMEKLDMRNIARLTKYAIDKGLIE